MRIEKLEVKAFGPWSGLCLEFGFPQNGLHVVFGPNEAGKSSLQRAVLALLFGVPQRTSDNFLHANTQLRIGAVLTRQDGSRLSVVRRKGLKSTLLDMDDNALDEAAWKAFCGFLDETTFTSLFCLNHERLRQGGSELLAGGGSLGESLFEAGSGLLHLRKTLQALELESARWFRPQASNPLVNAALKRYAEARRQVREHAVKADEWARLQRELETAQGHVAQADEALSHARRQHQHLQRWQRSLPLLARRANHLAALHDLRGTPFLPLDASREREQASRDLFAAATLLRNEEQKIERLRQELESVPELASWSEYRGRIDDLYKNLGSYRDASRDRPKRQSELDAREARAASIWADIQPNRPLSEAAAMRLGRAQAADIRERIKAFGQLSERERSCHEQCSDIEDSLLQARHVLSHMPPPQPTEELAAAIASVQTLGDVEQRYQLNVQQAAELHHRLQAELQSWWPWRGSLEQCEVLPAPPRHTVELFERKLSELLTQENRIEESSSRAREELARVSAERDRLEASGEVPTHARLREARERRDRCWADIRQFFVEKSRPLDEAATVLPQGYERQVTEADHAADSLRADSKRSVQYETLTRAMDALEEELHQLQARAYDLHERRRLQEEEWVACWAPAGLVPRSPREMLGWLEKREHLLERLAQWRVAERSAATLRQGIDAARVRLERALRPMAEVGLHDLLQAAERALAAASETNHQRKSAEAAIADLEAKLRAAEGRAARARQELASWQQGWSAAIAVLGQATPLAADSMLNALGDLFAALDAAHELRHRIAGMDATIARYRSEVAEVVTALAADLGPLAAADSAVEELHRRLALQSRQQQRQHDLRAQLRDHAEAVHGARDQMAAAEARLALLCEQAGCQSAQELPAIEERSALQSKLQAEVAQLEEQLTADHLAPLEQVVRELEAVDADSLPHQLQRLEEELPHLDEERSRLIHQVADMAAALRHIDGSPRAAAFLQETQEAAAEIRQGAAEFARLQAAAWLLRRAIDDYRERNQGPVLKRAGELFCMLTRGSFEALRPQFDEQDRAVLVGMRPNGDHVTVEGMSEGTVDQLYLALRLAAIERHLDAAEPVPLIFDDILIHFDDDRARATLEVLENIARRTQVLLFTHHEHVLALAERTLPACMLGVHRLPPRLWAVESGKPAQDGTERDHEQRLLAREIA